MKKRIEYTWLVVVGFKKDDLTFSRTYEVKGRNTPELSMDLHNQEKLENLHQVSQWFIKRTLISEKDLTRQSN